MNNFLIILTALISLLVIGVVLIQNPKGGGVDPTMGGAAANQMFGAAKSTDIIEKITWYLGGGLMAICLIYVVLN
jgi:preprotein translocase subunit SecG